ncbi:hypothetical protein CE91St63_32860 [[Clostridium] hylemonae]|nr:hypothetical protein CE91St63_32860 [[Clostridium] hylemonae]
MKQQKRDGGSRQMDGKKEKPYVMRMHLHKVSFLRAALFFGKAWDGRGGQDTVRRALLHVQFTTL